MFEMIHTYKTQLSKLRMTAMISFPKIHPKCRPKHLSNSLLLSLILTTACTNVTESPTPFNDTWLFWGLGGTLALLIGLMGRIVALRKSEELHRITLENISDPVFITDDNGRYTYICANTINSLEYSPPEIEAMGPITNLLGDNLFDPTALQAQGKITNIEKEIITKSGQTKTFLIEVKQVNIKGGTTLYTCRDITERKAKQDLLNKYQQIIAGTPDSISLVDTNYIYQVVNPAYMQRTTKPYHEIVGHSVSEIMGADVFEKLIKPEFDACLRGKTIQYQEWFMYAGEGHRFMDITYAPFQNETEEIEGVLVSARDLTETKLAEERLQKEMARFQAVWQSASDAMALSDENGTVLEINPAYETLYGYTRDEVVGHNFAIIFPEEVREWANAEYQKTFANLDIPPRFESVVQRRDGSQRDVESRVSFLNEDGKRTAMLSTVRDVTGRKQEKSALQESLARWESLVHHAPYYIAILDHEGSFQFINQPPPGRSIEDMIETTAYDHIDPKYHDMVKEKIQHVFETRQSVSCELESYGENGQQSWYETRFSPLILENEVAFVTMIATDISERKQAEDKIQKITENLETAQRIAHIGSWEWEMPTNNAHWSNEMYRIHGREKALGVPPFDSWMDSYHPDDHEPLLSVMQSAIEGDVPYAVEYRIFKETDGEERVIRSQGTVVRDETGKPVRLVGTAQDITEQVEAKRAVQASEANLRALIDAIDDAVLLVEPDGKIVECNNGLALRFGKTKGELLETKAQELLETAVAENHLSYINQVIATGEPVRFVNEQSGQIFDNSFYPVKDAAGKVVRLAISARDITQQRHMAEALRVSEERYRQVVTYSPMGIFVVQTGQYSFANPAGARLMGYTKPEDILGISALDTIAPDSRELAMQRLQQIAQDKNNKPVEMEILQADGSITITESISIPILFDDKPAALIIGQDVTERRRLERSLKDSEKRLRILFDNAHDNILVHSLDENDRPGRYIEVNESTCRTLGYTREELLQMSPMDTNSPDAAFDMQKNIGNLVQDGYASFETVGRTKDGHHIPFEINAHMLPIGDERLVMSISRDISERKQAEAALQKQAQQMQQIMDCVPEGVLVLDSEYHVVMANPVAFNELPFLTDTAPGEKLVTLGNYPVSQLLEATPEGTWHDIEYDGRFFAAIARPLTGEPQTEGWVLVISDVTQQRKIQTIMQQQERLASIGQLAAGIAHDFNNILAVIALYTEVTLNESFLAATTRQRLGVIEDQVRKASDLTQQMLDFSRSAMLQPQPLDFIAFLTNQIDLLKRTLPENIAIDFTYSVGNYGIKADPVRLQQVIMNLAINARDSMPAGGKLHFSLKEFQVDVNNPYAGMETLPAGVWNALAISDSGTGIADDLIGHVFEPFFTTKEPGKGTGLGLAQVYGIVKQHNGEVVVKSQPDQGTTFTIFLPAFSELAEVPTRVMSDPPIGQQDTILIVEDEDILREVLADSLKSLNYQVITAVNGEEALAIYKKQRAEIALVLSDMIMPGISGEILFHKLKEQNPAVKMIILTGYAQKDKLQDLRLQGLENWLSKPPSLQDLARVLAKSLQQ
jgi:PAS domain S-box-containing protein